MKEYPDNFPWREFLKECIPFAVVLVVYFTLQFAISAESIEWMLKEHRTVAASATSAVTDVTDSASRGGRDGTELEVAK